MSRPFILKEGHVFTGGDVWSDTQEKALNFIDEFVRLNHDVNNTDVEYKIIQITPRSHRVINWHSYQAVGLITKVTPKK